jgi:hypothetical protein
VTIAYQLGGQQRLNWDEKLAHLNLSYNYLRDLIMVKEEYLNRPNKLKRKNILFFEWDDTFCNCYLEWLTDYGHTCVFTKRYEEGLVVFKDSIKKSDDKFFDLVVITDDLPSDNQLFIQFTLKGTINRQMLFQLRLNQQR